MAGQRHLSGLVQWHLTQALLSPSGRL
jgi:hypothetical protein